MNEIHCLVQRVCSVFCPSQASICTIIFAASICSQMIVQMLYQWYIIGRSSSGFQIVLASSKNRRNVSSSFYQSWHSSLNTIQRTPKHPGLRLFMLTSSLVLGKTTSPQAPEPSKCEILQKSSAPTVVWIAWALQWIGIVHHRFKIGLVLSLVVSKISRYRQPLSSTFCKHLGGLLTAKLHNKTTMSQS